MNFKQIARNGFKNKNIRFIFFRYFIYVIQFTNSLFIAKNLGPFFLGELGFMTLAIQYLTQINFGIPNALNVKLSTYEGKDDMEQSIYMGNSLTFTFAHSALILIMTAACFFIDIPIFDKYDFYEYIVLVAFISIASNLDLLFVHAFRVKNLLKPIALYQSIMPILNLVDCFIWKGKNLLYALMFTQLFSYGLPFIIFMLYSPIKLAIRINWKAQRELLRTGMALLLYTASFYFIMIITRTFVSYFFDVRDLGYYSFALNLAQASFLALDTISFLIFPKLINRLKHKKGDELFRDIEYVRSNYNLIAFMLIFVTILVFPVILIFLPGYAPSFKPFTLLSISLALLSGNFGISTLFISSGKEFLLGKVALVAFLLNLILVWIISMNTSNFYIICFAPFITYLVYSFLLGYFYNVVFLKTNSLMAALSNFDLRLIFPAVLLLFAVLSDNTIVQVIAYASVLLLNYKRILGLLPVFRNLINNPSLFKI